TATSASSRFVIPQILIQVIKAVVNPFGAFRRELKTGSRFSAPVVVAAACNITQTDTLPVRLA
ncbi:MAG: hypothetical protein J2P13_08585, partial [Acidobacteria bacterium]|nr:hypothetical protein [Acidobacteriota bacterium]